MAKCKLNTSDNSKHNTSGRVLRRMYKYNRTELRRESKKDTMPVDYVSFGYAALVAAGGIMGYVKAGSTASLGMGLAFGAVLAFGAYQTTQNPNNYYVGLGTSAVLAGVMGHRFMNSGKFMPAGLVATLSIAMVLRYAARSYMGTKQA